MILDASGLALKAALGSGVFLVKLDLIEIRSLAAALSTEAKDPVQMARSIRKSGGAEVVIVALGADGALLVSEDATIHVRPPEVEVVSMIGAGDSYVGALTFALVEGWSLEQACAYGVAAAAAAVTTEATELAHKPDVDRLYARIDCISPSPWL